MVDFQMNGRLSHELDQTGEADYAEHARAQRLSRLERVVVIFALLLLATAGFVSNSGAYLQNGSQPAYGETTGSIGNGPGELQYCREGSPYPERAC